MPGRQDSTHSPLADELIDCFNELIRTAQRHRQRRVLVLTGRQDWCLDAAGGLLQHTRLESIHWFGARAPEGVPSSQGAAAFRLLGSELDVLVFDAWSGFDPDAFGALTGTLRAGGLLLLLAPVFTEWPDFSDPQNQRITVAPYAADRLSGRFLKRLANIIETDPDVALCREGRFLKRPAAGPAPECKVQDVDPPYRTRDQQAAVEAVVKVVTGHRRRPVVLTSDRGRGKSAAFGIAAAQLIGQGRRQILLTGPRLQSVEAVLHHARALLEEQDHRSIRFVAPDELAQQPIPADLLLVDEAAAIPAPLLETLLKRYARIAFATTVHGYEGTGRGFAVRFNRILDNNCNSWKSIALSTPIRWALNDPLERLSFRMLLLDANAVSDEFLHNAARQPCTQEQIDRDRLVEDESSLSELFGLLVQAHYKTRPLDLRHLLDGPNLTVYVSRADRHIAATALVAGEGGFDAQTVEAIGLGRARPHGHLLPETLAVHQGLIEAPGLRCARIMRIAVHPALQGRGLGTRLVRYITEQARHSGYEYLGSSFGATRELLSFWKQLDWLPVRLSIRRGASSGSHSVVMLHALTDTGNALLSAARERFFAQFPHQLSDSLQDVEAELVAELMQNSDAGSFRPCTADLRDARALAFEQRLLEVSIGSLWRLVCHALMESTRVSRLDEKELTLLVMRVLQKRSWQDCARVIDVPGRSQALAVLRRAVAKLIE